MRFHRFLTLSTAVALALAISVGPAGAQIVVSDPGLLSATVTHDAASQTTQTAQLGQQTATTANIISQVKQMILDHIPLSNIIQAAGGKLTSVIGQNASILSTAMSLDGKTLADFKKLAPSYTSGTSYLNYIATLKRNSNTQYAQSLSLTQQQLQDEGGVGSAVSSLTTAPASNQLQALQTMIGIGQLQTKQMDSLIKIQSAMLKSMATYYANAHDGGLGELPIGSGNEPARMLCVTTIPGYVNLTGAQKQSAFNNCQTQLNQAQQTANSTGTGGN